MPGSAIDRYDRVRDMSTQPGAMRGRHEHVVYAITDFHGHPDLLQVEAPRPDICQIVVHPAPDSVSKRLRERCTPRAAEVLVLQGGPVSWR